MRKKLAFALALAICLGGCGLDDIDRNINEKVDEKIEQHAVNKTKYDQERVNSEVIEGLAAGKRKIVFDGVVSTDMVQKALDIIPYDAPEVFWTGAYTVATDYSSTTLECESIYDLEEDELAEMAKEMNAAADEVISKANTFDNDFDKLLSVHNSLIEICDYDYEAFENIDKAKDDPEAIGFAGSAYGCLVEHEAVCSGYSSAFMLVARKMGFECGAVSGFARDGQHAWNYVKADGDYYWVDITWDENATENDTKVCPMYRFFLVNDDIIMKDRTVDAEVPFVPECTSLEDNYYVRKGLYMDSYSFEDVDNIMSAHEDEGGADMMFADDDSYAAAISDIIDSNNIWNATIIQNGRAPGVYYADANYRTLTLTWE